MLAGRERGLRMSVVKVVRRRDVDYVNPVVREHRLHRFVGGWQARRARSFGCARAAGTDDAVDLDAETAQRVHVDQADESRADDSGAQLPPHRCSHAAIRLVAWR